MIWVDCIAKPSLKSFDAALLLAQQLARLGLDPVIDEAALPSDVDGARRYEAAPFLSDIANLAPDRLILLGVHDLDIAALDRLRFGPTPLPARIDALGRFGALQDKIDAQTKLSYALGQDVVAADLNLMQNTPLIAAALAPLFGETLPARGTNKPVVQLYFDVAMIEDASAIPTLEALSYSDAFALEVIIAGAGKAQIRQSRASDINVFAYSELPPFELSARADVFVIFGPSVPGERMAQHAANMLVNARPVIDCTQNRTMAAEGLPVLVGPGELAALGAYLEKKILPDLQEVSARIAQSNWPASNAVGALCAHLDLNAMPDVGEDAPGEIVMLPTNGTGLGHARRTLLVAKEVDRHPVRFAAFPSCAPMIQAAGFACDPMISRSDLHQSPTAHDVLNYTRLRRIVGPRDTFVFDGGYVFDSVLRTLAETQAAAIWIRRGLWLAGQKRDATLEREKAFGRVIVPQEAFEDLNEPLSFGRHVMPVGPVVAQGGGDPAATRQALAKRFDRSFDHLVVSMLGGGEASDRTAQAMHLAALAERRPGLLHLSIAWPGAVVAPGLLGWKNTEVVQTQDALSLAQAADFVVSAVGYNGFHECLYHQIPALFVPQIAPYMDDQERRARAAVERGLAELAMPGEMALFERLFDGLLSGRADTLRAAMANEKLPERGNIEAAALIQEVADGHA